VPKGGSILPKIRDIDTLGFGRREWAINRMRAYGGQRSAPEADNDQILDALRLIAHVAVMLNDVSLADAVAEASLERLSIKEDRQSVVEAVHRLIECSVADGDRDNNAKIVLARRLEQLGFLVRDRSLLTEVAAYIELLKTIDAGLLTGMGRALAMAKLGTSRSVA
jgi:hypothetical protein